MLKISKTKTIIAILFIVSTSLFAQGVSYELTSFPNHFQLFPRDTSGGATVKVSGNILDLNYTKISVKLYRNGALHKNYEAPLSYIQNKAAFDLKPWIEAELAEYKIELYVHQGTKATLLEARDSLVAGDVYLIAGQSNSHPADKSVKYENEFARTLGGQTAANNTKAYNPADTLWGKANAHGFGLCAFCGQHLVGVWGLELMKNIIETYKVPVCIINGGLGGSKIIGSLRDDNNPEGLGNSKGYGTMLYRTRKARVDKQVKAVFWHQGESDVGKPFSEYEVKFDKLYKAWHEDYSSIKNIYSYQINVGCGNDGTDDLPFREGQRTLGEKYEDVTSMASVGFALRGDKCHYTKSAYTLMGQQAFRLLERDFYGATDTVDITSPNIAQAYYTTNAHQSITLEFTGTNTMVLGNDTMGHNIKEAFYLDSLPNKVIKVEGVGNKVILTLDAPSQANGITYLPGDVYEGGGIYKGPFLKSSREVMALSFHNFSLSEAPVSINGTIKEQKQGFFNYSSVERLEVTLVQQEGASITLILRDLLGKELFSKAYEVNHQQYVISEPLSITLTEGVYFLSVKQKTASHLNNIQTKRIYLQP